MIDRPHRGHDRTNLFHHAQSVPAAAEVSPASRPSAVRHKAQRRNDGFAR